MNGKKTQEDRKCQTLTGFFFFYFLAPVNELSKPSLFAGKKLNKATDEKKQICFTAHKLFLNNQATDSMSPV